VAAPRTLTFGRLSRGPAGGAATPPAPFIDADDDAGQARPLPDVRADDDSAFADVTLPEMPAGIDGRELVQRMLRESLAFFASEVIRGDVTGSGTGGTFIAADFHIEWDDVLRKHKKICILAPRDHGKCSPAGHLILAADGRRVPIEKWQGGTVIAFDPESMRLVPAQASPVQSNGRKPTLRIRTRTGREETVTLNHPLRKLDRWVRADELRVGDRIAVPKALPVNGAKPIRSAWLLGAMLGDGGLTCGAQFSNIDPGIVAAVQAACDERGWKLRKTSDNDYNLSNDYKPGGPIHWIRELGIEGCGSYEKRIPDVVFTAPNEDVADVLAGLIDTDGHVSTHGGGMVELYSVSVDLLRDAQHLLTRLGVVSVLTLKNGQYKGENHKSWRLTIRGRSILRLGEVLRLRGEKGPRLAALVEVQRDKDEGGSVDLLPQETYAVIQKSADWHRHNNGVRYSKKYDLTRSKAIKIAEVEGNDRLRQIAEAPILWDEIVAIEDAGEQETYFITVPGLESYVGDDIINHNSQTLTIALPIWEAWRRPGIEVAIFSEIQPQAEAQLAKLKQQIENNPRLQHLVDPAMWSAQKIRLTNGSTIIAKGFGVKTRGMHPHLIICDDVVSEASMYSSLVRERQANYFYGAIRNMLVPGGQIVVVGTPQHEEDLYGLLERNNEWFFKRYQAIDKAGKILFPERYDEKLLAERRREIGEIRFTREFLCLPISGGSSLFPEELVSGEPFFALNARVGSMVGERPAREWWVERGIRAFYIGVDIATSTSTRADYFVIFVIGIDAFGNRWVVDIFREQGLEYKAQKAKIHEYAKLWRAEMVCVESNQAQKIWGQELIQDTDLPIYMHQTGSEKHGLEKGIPSLRVLFENGKYRCPRGDDETITITNIWLAELQSWTFTKEKGVISIARHDDVAMAQWLCELAIGKGDSFSFSFGETEGDAQVAAEEEALAREFDAKITAGLDPWETMGIEAEDLVPRPGRPRANLDFAPPGSQPPGMTSGARPAHPLGPGIPLLGGNGWGRS